MTDDDALTLKYLALALVAVGSLAIVISAFLPLHEAVASNEIEQNTMIQGAWGWAVVVIAVAIVGYAYRLSQGQSNVSWSPLVLCALAALLLIWRANEHLYPVDPGGGVDSSQPGVAAGFGIAVYVGGVGIAVAAVGSLMLRHTASNAGAVGDDGH